MPSSVEKILQGKSFTQIQCESFNLFGFCWGVTKPLVKPAQAVMIEWGWPCQGSKPLHSEFVAEVWSIIIITSDSEESIKVWALGSNLLDRNVKISLIMQIVLGVRKSRKIVWKYSFYSILQQSYLHESGLSSFLNCHFGVAFQPHPVIVRKDFRTNLLYRIIRLCIIYICLISFYRISHITPSPFPNHNFITTQICQTRFGKNY